MTDGSKGELTLKPSESTALALTSTGNNTVAVLGGGGQRKQRANVLDEETFIKRLEDIIEKSFFPDLEKLRIQEAYYNALKVNDLETLRELYFKYNNLMSHRAATESKRKSAGGFTPALFDDDPDAAQSEEETKLPYANEEPPNKKCK